jgi:hypothetical protein
VTIHEHSTGKKITTCDLRIQPLNFGGSFAPTSHSLIESDTAGKDSASNNLNKYFLKKSEG